MFELFRLVKDVFNRKYNPIEYPVTLLGGNVAPDESELNKFLLLTTLFTYRSGFRQFARTDCTSDKGWGCLIRTCQMMVARCLTLHGQLELSWFRDLNNDECPFAIHKFIRFVQNPNEAFDTKFWTPAQGCEGIRNTLIELGHMHILQRPLTSYVCSDSTIVVEDVQFRLDDGMSVLILLPTVTGVQRTITQGTYLCLEQLLQVPQCCGIVAGVPNRSYFIMGVSGQRFCFLDPHTTQPAFTSGNNLGVYYETATTLPAVAWSRIDSSVLLGFYISSHSDWDSFVDHLAIAKKRSGIELFSVATKAMLKGGAHAKKPASRHLYLRRKMTTTTKPASSPSSSSSSSSPTTASASEKGTKDFSSGEENRECKLKNATSNNTNNTSNNANANNASFGSSRSGGCPYPRPPSLSSYPLQQGDGGDESKQLQNKSSLTSNDDGANPSSPSSPHPSPTGSSSSLPRVLARGTAKLPPKRGVGASRSNLQHQEENEEHEGVGSTCAPASDRDQKRGHREEDKNLQQDLNDHDLNLRIRDGEGNDGEGNHDDNRIHPHLPEAASDDNNTSSPASSLPKNPIIGGGATATELTGISRSRGEREEGAIVRVGTTDSTAPTHDSQNHCHQHQHNTHSQNDASNRSERESLNAAVGVSEEAHIGIRRLSSSSSLEIDDTTRQEIALDSPEEDANREGRSNVQSTERRREVVLTSSSDSDSDSELAAGPRGVRIGERRIRGGRTYEDEEGPYPELPYYGGERARPSTRSTGGYSSWDDASI